MSHHAAHRPASSDGDRPDGTATGHRHGGGAAATRPQPAALPATPSPVCAVPTRAERTDAARVALAQTLEPVLRQLTGALAIGVTDLSTGVTLTYHFRQEFHTASIVKVDILATLLLQLQGQHAAISPEDASLAIAMIEESDNDAATDLWNIDGATAGLAAANQTLRLRHTVLGTDDLWGLTSTTVTDQLRLLSALTSANSPLTPASRHYELALMRNVDDGQNWGVTAAASPRTRPAVKNGWLPDGPEGLWDINSIGVITHHHQRLLMAVLSNGQPDMQTGIDRVQAAARAAAAAVTRSVPGTCS